MYKINQIYNKNYKIIRIITKIYYNKIYKSIYNKNYNKKNINLKKIEEV
jgi:hypothetical protein